MDTKVSLTRHTDYSSPDKLVEALVALVEPLGGWERVLSAGDRVLLKPNLVFAVPREQNATTDPAIVEAVIRICKDFDCKVQVGDASVFGTAAAVGDKTGLLDVCKKYDVELITLGHSAAFSVDHRRWTVSKDLKWADKVINLPKLKAHSQLYFTGAVKNLFGCVVGKRKFLRHMTLGDRKDHFAKMLLDTARHIAPTLNIIDGIHAMAGDGPVNGTTVELGLLGAAKNPLALDWAVVNWLGGDKDKAPYFRTAADNDFWQLFCEPEVLWVGDKFAPQGFFFPDELAPIRFRAFHAVRSVYRTARIQMGKTFATSTTP